MIGESSGYRELPCGKPPGSVDCGDQEIAGHSLRIKKDRRKGGLCLVLLIPEVVRSCLS